MTEQTEITEQTEKRKEEFPLFRYFRLFRNLFFILSEQLQLFSFFFATSRRCVSRFEFQTNAAKTSFASTVPAREIFSVLLSSSIKPASFSLASSSA